MRGAGRLALAAAAIASGTLAAQDIRAVANPQLVDILKIAGERIEQYYQRAQSLVCTESVLVQQVRSDMSPNGFARSLEYELHVDWTPAADGGVPDANVVRELRKINGRPARPGDEPKCLDPAGVSPEPLAFMLPGKREEYTFSLIGPGQERKHPALMMEYKSRVQGKPEVTWKKDDCTNVSLPGWSKGRVWLDPDTHDILRVDEALTRRFDYRVPYEQVRKGFGEYWTLERADSSTRYQRVRFSDPEESVLLPESIDSLVIFRGPGTGGHRTTQRFTNYRRFLTGGRIVK